MALSHRSGLLRELTGTEALNSGRNNMMGNYFKQVERFCDSVVDIAGTHAQPINEANALHFDMNLPLERAFIEPGALIE